MDAAAVRDSLSRSLSEAAQEVREQAFESRRARALDQESRPSRADEFAEGWDELDKPMRDGWNVTGEFLQPGEGGRRRKRMR